MESAFPKLKPGDQVAVTYQDGSQLPVLATVLSFASDTDEGFSPEIEDYVA